VEVNARLEPDQPSSRWHIAVRRAGEHAPLTIRFPRLLEVAGQPQERLAVPEWLGKEAANPRALLRGNGREARRFEWPYPGLLSLQCLALSAQDGPGSTPRATTPRVS